MLLAKDYLVNCVTYRSSKLAKHLAVVLHWTMAEMKAVSIVPLNGKNYPTWKVQCRMALMKDGLWGIVNGSERDPGESQVEAHKKFVSRRDRALALVVLAVEPSLLYLIGDPEDPVAVWNKLEGQFQKKTWANKLELRRKLYSLRLKDGESVHEHISDYDRNFRSACSDW